MEHIISSTIGTIVAELITIPICTVKTNMIVNNSSESTMGVIKSIYHNRGLYGFYNSCAPAITSQIISTASKYTIYKMVQEKRQTQKDDILNNIPNGICGGIVGSVLSHPFDVMKSIKQNDQSIKQTFNTKIMYRGYSKSLTKTCMLGAILFPSYDFFKKHTNNGFFASVLTCITSSAIIYPIEYTKIRQMVLGEKINFDYNIKKYYTSYTLHIMRIIPHFTISMYIIDKLTPLLKY
jgi:hypothetical protein